MNSGFRHSRSLLEADRTTRHRELLQGVVVINLGRGGGADGDDTDDETLDDMRAAARAAIA